MTTQRRVPRVAEASVRKSVLFVICEHAVVIGSGFAVSVMLARGLSPEDYGTVRVFEYLAVVAIYLFSLAFERTLGRYVAEIRATVGGFHARRVYFSLVAIRLAVCMVLGIAVYAFSDDLGKLFEAPVLFDDYVGLTAGFVVLTILNNLTGRAWLTALAQRHLVSIGHMVRRILLVAVVAALFFHALQLALVLWAILGALIVEFLILGILAVHMQRRLGDEPGRDLEVSLPADVVRRIQRFIYLNAPWQWMQVFREIAIDSLVIAAILGPEAVAYYAIAAVFPQQLRRVSPTKILGGILIPKVVRQVTVSGTMDSLRLTFELLTKINLSLFAPAALVIVLNVDWFIPLVFGGQYSASHTTAVLLMCSLILTILADPFYVVCDVLDLPGIMFRSSLWGFLNLILDIALVDLLGIEGAALATLIVSIILILYFHIAIRHALQDDRFSIPLNLVARTLIGLSIILAVDLLARAVGGTDIFRTLGAFLGSAVYIGFLWRFHPFTKLEVQRLRSQFLRPIRSGST